MKIANKHLNLKRLTLLFFAIGCLLIWPASLLASPNFDIWYGQQQNFGQLGNPQIWVNVLGNVSSQQGRIVSLEHSLNNGPFRPLLIGPDSRRLCEEGDFCVEIHYTDLNDGANQLVLRATDEQGSSSQKSVTINYETGNIWPENYQIDWSMVTNIQDAIQIVDGKWAITSQGLRTTSIGYDRLVAFGDIMWDDYEITVPVTVHDFDPKGFNWPSNHPGFGIFLRWTGHTDDPVNCGQFHCGWFPFGGALWYDWDSNGGVCTNVIQNHTVWDCRVGLLEFDVCYDIKMRVETRSGQNNHYSVKVWRHGDSEPSSWAQEKILPTEMSFGSILLLAHHVDVTIGDITVFKVGESAPLISNINVTASQTSADITWTTNKPATSSVDYGTTIIYEAGSVDDSRLVTNHAVTLTGLQSDTLYHFQISSTDSAGNTTFSADNTFNTKTSSTSPPAMSEDFDSYQPGDDPDDWFDTAAFNSMSENDSLFKVRDVAGQRAIGTSSTQINIHSHFVEPGSSTWADYEYTGQVRVSDTGSGIGVTFLSDYPNSDSYYRLRREKSKQFHIAPHGTNITGGTINTGVIPQPNTWYNFRINVEDTGSRTEIRAKVWQQGTNEPGPWQVDCYDSSSSRLTKGTVGLWSMRAGVKYWDSLEVQLPGQAPPPTEDGELIGYWKFDDASGNLATDSSGKGNTGTLINGPAWTAGRFDGALRFDGINDAVEIPTTNIKTSGGTISLWAYQQDRSGSQYFFGHTVGSWSNRIQLHARNGKLHFGLGKSRNNIVDIPRLSLRTWYHLVLTWDGTNYAVYVNGIQKASGLYSGLTTLNAIADIGNDGNISFRDETFDGIIDEVRLYDYAISADMVQQLYIGP